MYIENKIPFHDFGGNGPLLHFAHANAYPPACYRQTVEPLLDHFRVIGICQRPLWPSSQPTEMVDWRMLADDLLHFFEQQGIDKVIGVGHSMGAVATMMASLKRPSLFRALLLIEPVFLPPQVLKVAAANPAGAEQLPLVQIARKRRDRWPSRQEAFARWRAKKVFASWSDVALWDYVEYALLSDGQGEFVLTYSRDWEAQIYAHPPLTVWEEIPQITRSTLAIRGADSDTLYPLPWQLWQTLHPDTAFIEVPDAGHMVPMERPLQLAKIILDYCKAKNFF